MRCSQVVTAESPRKESARRKAAMNASCTASAAISGSRVVRKATAHIRSRWRRKSSPKASGSPAQCAGDPDAFGELFRRHRDRMWAVALRTTRDPEIAADAVQEAFIAAFRRADSFRGEAAVTTWLHRIVVNSCLDRLRRIKPVVHLPNADLSVLADSRDHHHSVDVRLDVRAALEQLPEGQRMALVLVDMHGLSIAEAANVLAVAEGTVKSRC